MTWWLLILAILGYLTVGLGLARVAFIDVLKDSPRFKIDRCNERFCNHLKVITIDDKRHYFTGQHLNARSWARWTFVGWPFLIVGTIGWGIWQVVTRGYGHAVYRPTKAEKLTQRQRELVALSAKAKEMGLPVPDEWTQESSRLEPDKEIDKMVQEIKLAKLRDPDRYNWEEHVA